MLHDDIAAVLPELRAHAESRMQRPCVARVVTGVEPDPATGADVVTYGAPVYEGMCRVPAPDRGAIGDLRDVQTASVGLARIQWHIPYGSPAVPRGAVIFFEDDMPPHRVLAPVYGDDVTARRYMIEEVS